METAGFILGAIGVILGLVGLTTWRLRLQRPRTFRTVLKSLKNLEAEIRAYSPDVVVGLADGLVVAAIITLNYRVPQMLAIEGPVRGTHNKRATQFHENFSDLGGKKVLLVDLHIYTGTNLRAAVELVSLSNPSEIRTLVLFKHEIPNRAIEPDYYARSASGAKAKVPWSLTPEHRETYLTTGPRI